MNNQTYTVKEHKNIGKAVFSVNPMLFCGDVFRGIKEVRFYTVVASAFSLGSVYKFDKFLYKSY